MPNAIGEHLCVPLRVGHVPDIHVAHDRRLDRSGRPIPVVDPRMRIRAYHQGTTSSGAPRYGLHHVPLYWLGTAERLLGFRHALKVIKPQPSIHTASNHPGALWIKTYSSDCLLMRIDDGLMRHRKHLQLLSWKRRGIHSECVLLITGRSTIEAVSSRGFLRLPSCSGRCRFFHVLLGANSSSAGTQNSCCVLDACSELHDALLVGSGAAATTALSRTKGILPSGSFQCLKVHLRSFLHLAERHGKEPTHASKLGWLVHRHGIGFVVAAVLHSIIRFATRHLWSKGSSRRRSPLCPRLSGRG
mmetsp:Transcript_97864/g.169488  ORF Transcript_97864/g.169488 Transcript_97864/m.169488 type:complete len:302 (+) Transcript_97864:1312-2217(+)